MLLPQEMLKQYNSQLTLTIGKHIAFMDIKNSKISHKDWAQKVKKIVYSL
jgi:hypothetical protein